MMIKQQRQVSIGSFAHQPISLVAECVVLLLGSFRSLFVGCASGVANARQCRKKVFQNGTNQSFPVLSANLSFEAPFENGAEHPAAGTILP